MIFKYFRKKYKKYILIEIFLESTMLLLDYKLGRIVKYLTVSISCQHSHYLKISKCINQRII